MAWNCRGNSSKKAPYIWELNPDIAILCEVREDAFERSITEGAVGLWTGAEGSKGLAIVGRNGWLLQEAISAADRHVFAVEAVNGETKLNVVGVWAMPERSDYVGPLARSLGQLTPRLTGNAVVAGDFNANPRWDDGKSKSRQFKTVVDNLATLGLRSLWHFHTSVTHGEETTPTYLHRGNTSFHIDYVFVSDHLMRHSNSIQLGSHDEWIANGRSDHVPIIVDLSLT